MVKETKTISDGKRKIIMKILVAPNSFKESLNSLEIAECIEKGLKNSSTKFKIIKLPFADGGTGTCEILTKSLNGKFINLKVSGPLPKQKVTAIYGIVENIPVSKSDLCFKENSKTAIIELSSAAGLKLVPEEKRNPLITTTKGVGELILDSIKRGCKNIILGIGDSATIDCGVGALSVLGFKFLDKTATEIPLNCSGLNKLYKIQFPKNIKFLTSIKIVVASDVTNPLTGNNGAIMFAKQKGATEKSYHVIANAVKNFKKIVLKQLGVDIDKIPGSGAAGGIGGAMKVLLNAQIKPGVEIVSQVTNFEHYLKRCDLVITGEGKIDSQTLYGKTVKYIIDVAKRYNKPVICIAGTVTEDAKILYNYGVVGLYSIINSPMTLEDAISKTRQLVTNISESIGRTLLWK